MWLQWYIFSQYNTYLDIGPTIRYTKRYFFPVLIQLFHKREKTFSNKQRILPVGVQDCQLANKLDLRNVRMHLCCHLEKYMLDQKDAKLYVARMELSCPFL